MNHDPVRTALIVGAGFSHHAGLPLTSEFTEAILAARNFKGGPSRLIVDFLSRFVHETFDHSPTAAAKHWPELEDIFTCVDLSANSGHHLGSSFAPADLRTVRRALLSRIIRMLDQKYQAGRKQKGSSGKHLDDLFARLDLGSVGFISMNWDTVIERKLAISGSNQLFDYCCDAAPANIPDPIERDTFRSEKQFLRAVEAGQTIELAVDRKKPNRTIPLVKMHGSINWLYCDSCRQVFWVHPDQSDRIAAQLIRPDDLSRIKAFLYKPSKQAGTAIDGVRNRVQLKCQCSPDVGLGIRIATFSYRKALEFPMFQKSWWAAEEMLRSADKWVFVGYSLPGADYEFKYLLKRTQLSRRKLPEIVVVSGGPKAGVRTTHENYHKFFGRTVRKPRLFSSGLSPDAVSAICRASDKESEGPF